MIIQPGVDVSIPAPPPSDVTVAKGNSLAEVAKVPEREHKNTALMGGTILSDVPREAAGGSGPLGSLKAVLRTIAAVHVDHQETVSTGNRVESLLSRIVALEEHFYSRPDDVEEQRRRDKLIRESGRIEGQLRSLLGKPEAEQLAEHTQHSKEVYGLLGDLRETILDYQWLNGLAGTGKSTIAQTIAERIFADGQLGASFFCSQDFKDRRNLKFIFPTVAVQLARNHAGFRSIFVPLVQFDPEIAHESLYSQMDKLIVQPLKQSDVSTVIVIDALDECKDEEPASAILSVLGQFVSHIPNVKFFLTSRPEPRILEGFRLPLLAEATDVFVFHDVQQSLGLDDWPTREQLGLLCERAAGLFVYAAATIKFIDRRNNDPKEQLDRLLRSPESSAREGNIKLKANTTLDSLYMSILQEAFGDDDPEDDHKIRSVLGAVILAANPLSPSAIATLLGFGVTDVFLRLSSVHSLLILQEDPDSPVRPFHKSFPDFIVDPTRCINGRFHVSPPNHHPELLAGCIELMNQMLEKNMCDLPDGVANCEVGDLCERAKRHLDPALRYACKSWRKHLVDGDTVRTPAIASALRWFLEKKFLFWLEVLSVLGAAREAVDALDVAAKLLEVCRVSALDVLPNRPGMDPGVTDCFRFVMRFFEVISTSCPHIYHSALPLCPRKSIVRGLYGPHAYPLARIVRGLPNSWEPSIAAAGFPSRIDTAVWSPCSRFIAISWGTRPKTIAILDGVTLERINTLDYPLDEPSWTRLLIFSQNPRLLTWYGGYPRRFISWDLQMGGLVSTIVLEHPEDHLSLTYSVCGTMFAILIHGDPTFIVSIYNVLVGTLDSGSITTWEVVFASPHTPTPVESPPLPNNFRSARGFLFHPTSSCVVLLARGSVIILDAQGSKFLLEATDVNFSELTSNIGDFDDVLVSPNGGSIIAWDGQVVQLWHTTDSITSLSDPSTLTFQRGRNTFIMGFSPDEALAAVARIKDKTVMVLDLKSSIARLTIDTGMEVLGVARSSIVVVGEG
ncbi:hypothetical protein BDM02DRAFT_3192612 [Thelephora ganbajun]|uniref:Uncharacterized protein n=1 Tax=Thelephora ganbajun TaxID=370292 RepID=A0ACB6YZW4_THEGA|nr:hypothetical protein BDM02DRAFT_3192612 [Thelephora ganbajun]